jgi:PTS system nitrogen regulatory IIA component
VEFGALDGQAVSTLFTLISPTVRAHLHLLSRLGFALRDAEFKAAVTRQASREQILEALKRVEMAMGSPSRSQPQPAGAGQTPN